TSLPITISSPFDLGSSPLRVAFTSGSRNQFLVDLTTNYYFKSIRPKVVATACRVHIQVLQ
ncbi:hypothetical protein, partial [Pseudoalteromonas ruthenica]|uniref:hypothetical protein n=1 Tax=Pseudoalteromonas ruthenica TaxID=151081 RepID=UPI001BB0E296